MNILRKTLLVSVVISIAVISVGNGAPAQEKKIGVKTIVLDAGHGGKDPGCRYGGYNEKDITLAVALRLGALVEENCPDVKVIYTRKTDVFVPLDKRGDIANKAAADLFMSIHVNASKSTSARGTETFVMGITKSAGNLDIAMRENDVITYEQDYSTRYQGYTPGSSESFIIFSLMQYSYLEQSMSLAQIVQQQYQKTASLDNRGVKQAGFLVLWRTAMPSVLTELGFLSNSGDRAILTSRKGQERLARSLFNAFSVYKTKVEGKNSYKLLDVSDIDSAVDAESGATDTEQAPKAAEKDNRPVKPAEGTPAGSKGRDGIQAKKGEVVYRIQICSSLKRIPLNDATFKSYRNRVEERYIGGRYKYYVCPTKSYDEALALQGAVRRTFRDAFIVAFKNDKVVPVSSVRK